MSRLFVFNDLHLGVQRTGGTTPQSAGELRAYAHKMHAQLLTFAEDGDVVLINGDLTDQFNIDLGQAIEIYATAAEFMTQRPGVKLIWAVGNHDLSKDSSKLGTVAFLGSLLESQFDGRFSLVTKAQMVIDGFYVIPHVANQALFDLELERVPDEAKVVFLHCNYDNTFACAADHSLNLSRDQAKVLVKAGKFVVLGHEHQGRTMMGDKVVITGNQFPTSVSDCLSHGDAQKDGTKYALAMNLSDPSDMELLPTWSADDRVGGYAEIDWRQASSAPSNLGFIRVAGTATTEEAAEVVKVISTLRQTHKAFVITNAVKVEGVDGEDAPQVSIEDIKAVSVIELLMGMLDEPQQAAVQSLMKD